MLPEEMDAAVASVDRARRSLVVLAALLLPHREERAAFDSGDPESYLDHIAQRMRGVCREADKAITNLQKTFAYKSAPKKSWLARRRAEPAAEPAGGVQADVDRILEFFELADDPFWLDTENRPGARTDIPLGALVPLAARIAGGAVCLTAYSADRLTGAAAPDIPEKIQSAAINAGRTALRVARVLDSWNMMADTPPAIIGCPDLAWLGSGDTHRSPVRLSDERPSLGVALAMGVPDGSDGSEPQSATGSSLRSTRSERVWSAGGAIQRD